jgi:predicted small metal-binding protein
MPKTFYCYNLGISCKWVASADTEEELLKKILEHAAEEHNIKDMNEVQLERIKKLIKDI